ncbi:hypothetical protein ACFW9F_08255 [Streptomyces sp. NPDC059506]|uniref:hypothetical protein n=1 Tax=Streptomyces TaxID=1883 RepID=UPI0015F891C8|nr:hypothetical protein [Streptomyces sp. SCUT-3]QMV22306.1 hypothetical protein GQS52_11445 [Streptomyces sp. SCUT-3]
MFLEFFHRSAQRNQPFGGHFSDGVVIRDVRRACRSENGRRAVDTDFPGNPFRPSGVAVRILAAVP